MPQLYGRNEVRRQQQRVRTVFDLVDGKGLDSEVEAHFARYLCIRLAGFAEQSLKDLVSAHAKAQASPEVHRYVEAKVNLVWGINRTKLKETLDSLNPTWMEQLETSMTQELDTLHSVGKTRDNVSHGGDTGVTLITVIRYREDVFKLVNRLVSFLDPDPT